MKRNDVDMLPEYDFSKGIRGKHYRERQAGYTVTIHKIDGSTEVKHYGPRKAVALAPDVLKYFPNARAVNHALRSLIALFPKRAPAATRGIKNGQPSAKKTRAQARTKSKSINSR
jgi:hypothetical protein